MNPSYGAVDTRAYSQDVAGMKEEPPLVMRLEEVRETIRRCLSALDGLEQGPAVLTEGVALDRPSPGVLMLGAECEKAARELENRLLIVAKRIGRL